MNDSTINKVRSEVDAIRCSMNHRFDDIDRSLSSLRSSKVTVPHLQQIFQHLASIKMSTAKIDADVHQLVDISRHVEPTPTTCHVARCPTYQLDTSHWCIRSVWNEYHGLGRYQSPHFPGGIEALEKQHQHQWRRHFSPREVRYLAKMIFIVSYVQSHTQRPHLTNPIAPSRYLATIDVLDSILSQEKVQSVANIVKCLMTGKKLFSMSKTLKP